MKISQSSKFRSFILAAVLFSGLATFTHASAQERSYLIDLNTRATTDLGLSGPFSSASGINDVGQVGGVFFTAESLGRAFITGPSGEGIPTSTRWLTCLWG